VWPANTPGSGLYLIRTVYRTADGGHVDVTAVGEVDMADEVRFRDAVLGPLRQQSVNRVVVDLGRVRFMDASGARALIDAHQEAMRRAKQFHVVNVCGSPRRVLEILGVCDALTSNVWVAAGIEELTQPTTDSPAHPPRGDGGADP
jgi:anti-sigma B factor antagonist